MNKSRRAFITHTINQFGKLSLAALAGSTLASCSHKNFLNPDDDILISGGQVKSSEYVHGALITVNINQKEKRVILLPFVPHTTIIDPQNKYSLFCVEREGKKACSINLRNDSIETLIDCGEGQLFSGYAQFDQGGEFIYTIEYDENNLQGFVSQRNSRTLEVEQRLPTLGLKPAQIIINDHFVTISNTINSEDGFHKPSLVTIDLTSEVLIRRQRFPDDTQIIDKLITTPDKQLVIATRNNDNASRIFISDNKNIKPLEIEQLPQDLKNGNCDLVINNNDLYAAYPEADLILKIDLTKKQVTTKLELQQPRAISMTIDKKELIVSYGYFPTMIRLQQKDLSALPESYVRPTYSSAYSMMNWSTEIRKIMPSRIYD